MTFRKATRERLARGSRLRRRVRAERDTLVRRLANRPAAPPDAEPIYEALLDHMTAELAAVESRLEAAETAYAHEKALLAHARHCRDEAAAQLRSSRVEISWVERTAAAVVTAQERANQAVVEFDRVVKGVERVVDGLWRLAC